MRYTRKAPMFIFSYGLCDVLPIRTTLHNLIVYRVPEDLTCLYHHQTFRCPIGSVELGSALRPTKKPSNTLGSSVERHVMQCTGVEIHATHGYTIGQFTKDTCNMRNDMQSGSVENRTRFALGIVRKVTEVVRRERTAIRLGTFADNRDVGMLHPHPTFAYLVSRIREEYLRFSYLHVVEPRIAGVNDRTPRTGESIDFLCTIRKSPSCEKNSSVFVVTGGYTAKDALWVSEGNGDLTASGRHFISNVLIIKKDMPLATYERTAVLVAGRAKEYNDYVFADTEAEANYEKWRSRSTTIF